MAGKTLATASLKLTADAGGLTAGLQKTKSDINTFSKDSKKKLEEAKPKKDDSGGGFSKLALPLAAIAAGAFAFKALSGSVLETITSIKDATKAAREMGIGVEGFTALGHAAKVAGVSADDLKSGLSQVQTVLKSSDENAGRIFGGIGLEVEELRKLPIDEATAKIAGALEGISDPSTKGKAALQIFGEKAVQLEPLLAKGSSGIKALSDEAKKLGVSLSENDASKVAGASEAFEKISATWEAFKNQAVVTLAPIFENVVNWTIRVRDSVRTAFNGEVVRGFAVGLAYVFDSLKLVGGVIAEFVLAPTLKAFASMVDAAETTINALIDLANKLPRVNISKIDTSSVSNLFREMGNEAEKDGKKTRDAFGDSAKSVNAYFDSLKNKSESVTKAITKPLDTFTAKTLSGINQLEDELRKVLKTVGMTGAQQKIFDLEQQGAKPKDLENVKMLAEQARNVETAFNNIKEPPMSVFERSQEGLKTLLDNGRLTLEQYQLGIVEAAKSFQQQVGMTEVKSTGAVVAGSREAFSLINKSQQQNQQNDPMKAIQDANRMANQQRTKQLAVAERIAKAVETKEEPIEFEVI